MQKRVSPETFKQWVPANIFASVAPNLNRDLLNLQRQGNLVNLSRLNIAVGEGDLEGEQSAILVIGHMAVVGRTIKRPKAKLITKHPSRTCLRVHTQGSTHLE